MRKSVFIALCAMALCDDLQAKLAEAEVVQGKLLDAVVAGVVEGGG